MKKFLVALFIALLAAAAAFYVKPELLQTLLKDTAFDQSATTAILYKWRDRDGNWHITDDPPPAGTEFETLNYHPDINVLPLPPQLQPRD